MLKKKFNFKNSIIENFSPYVFKWIDSEDFLIMFKKIIMVFRIRLKKNNELKKLKFRSIEFLLPILASDLIKKKKIIIASGNKGNIFLKNFKNFNFFQIFFFNYILIFLKKDYLHTEIIFAIAKLQNKKNSNFNLKKKFSFLILNLEEGKFINIFNFTDYGFFENFFYLNQKNKIAILIHGKNLILFKINLNFKTIHIRKIFHSDEILAFDYLENFLIIGDKNGEIFIFKNYIKNFNGGKKNFKFCIHKKISFFLNYKQINHISFFNQNAFYLNLFNNSFLYFIDLKRNKKKVIFSLKKKENFTNIKINKKMRKLISTCNNAYYFFFNKKKFRILKFLKLNKLEFFNKIESMEKHKNLKIKIFPFLFFSKSLFGITGINNILKAFHFKKKKLNENVQNQNSLNLKINNSFCLDIHCNSFGNKIFLIESSSIIKISIEKFLLGDFNYLKKIKNKKTSDFKRIFNTSIDKNGKNIAFSFFNGDIKIWNSNPFLSFDTNKKKKILSYHRKKFSNFCISEKGNFLAFSFFKTIILWKIFPEIQKYKSVTFDFKNEICYLNFFSCHSKTFFILNSRQELSFLEISKFSIDLNIKINIFNIMIDIWRQQFVLLTNCFLPLESAIAYFIVVFKKNSPIPILSLKLTSLTKGKIISINFSFFSHKKRLRSLLLIDTFLEFHKIFY